MGNKISKSKIDLSTTLVEVYFQFKGKGELRVYTTVSQSCDFVDWLIKNESILTSHKSEDKNKIDYHYYTLDDYKKKSSITINLKDIKYFEIPFYNETGKDIEFSILKIN